MQKEGKKLSQVRRRKENRGERRNERKRIVRNGKKKRGNTKREEGQVGMTVERAGSEMS